MHTLATMYADAIRRFYGDNLPTVSAALRGEFGPEWQKMAKAKIDELIDLAFEETIETLDERAAK